MRKFMGSSSVFIQKGRDAQFKFSEGNISANNSEAMQIFSSYCKKGFSERNDGFLK
jgi:hypothetical protein